MEGSGQPTYMDTRNDFQSCPLWTQGDLMLVILALEDDLKEVQGLSPG